MLHGHFVFTVFKRVTFLTVQGINEVFTCTAPWALPPERSLLGITASILKRATKEYRLATRRGSF